MVKSRINGFSLIETLVVIGLLSIIGFALTTYVLNVSTQVSGILVKLDRLGLQNQIETNLRKANACAAILTSNGINLGTTPQLNLTVLKEYADNGAEIGPLIPGLNIPIYPGAKVKVESMRLTGPTGTGSPVLIRTEATSRTYISNLRITFQASPGDALLRPMVFPSLLIKTNSLGVSQTCALEKAINPTELCEQYLGQHMDTATGTCLPTTFPAQKALCANLGAEFTSGPWTCIMQHNLYDFTCPSPDEVITGFNDGVPICNKGEPTGIWSDWGSCVSGTQTRTCLIGTCPGPSSKPCT